MNSATVIIIGGGVIGLSTAYQLALRGAGRIVLLEKGMLGDGASSRAAGIGTHLMWSETGVRARQIGFRLFQQFSDEWDDYEFHNEQGCLNLFMYDAWSARQLLLPIYDRLHVPYEVLDASEIRHRWPSLSPPEHVMGLHDPNGGYSEPDEYLAALTRQVRDRGVEIAEDEAVVDFLRSGERITGVRTSKRSIHANSVVSTVHVWSLPLWNRLNLRLPMKHFVHQRYVTTPVAHRFIAPPVNADFYLGYVRPAKGNRILMGVETPHRHEYRVETIDFRMQDISVPSEVREQGTARLEQIAPALAGASWESNHVGVISYTSDGEPILGPAPGFAGLLLAASFHSGGFSYNSVAGLLLAELVTEGRACIDVSAFSPDRFSLEATDAHLATELEQCQAVQRRH